MIDTNVVQIMNGSRPWDAHVSHMGRNRTARMFRDRSPKVGGFGRFDYATNRYVREESSGVSSVCADGAVNRSQL